MTNKLNDGVEGKEAGCKSQDVGEGNPDGQYFFLTNLHLFNTFAEKISRQVEFET